jgi:hypothetical protein
VLFTLPDATPFLFINEFLIQDILYLSIKIISINNIQKSITSNVYAKLILFNFIWV